MNPTGQQPQPASATPESAPPKDALSKTNEELANEQVTDATGQTGTGSPSPEIKPVKQNALKRVFKKVDIYLLGFILAVVVAAAVIVVNYLNSIKQPKPVTVVTSQLTQDALKALSGSNVTVDNSAQTLTVEGNAVFSSQVLIRGALAVTGAIQAGGDITTPSLTTTASANLANTQINTLQVATNATVQGSTSLKDLTVSGTSTFNQPMTAAQITVTNLILNGNAVLQVPNHLAFTGPTPSPTAINLSVLGLGGTASVNGSDTAGAVNINTGNGPVAGCFVTVKFVKPFTSAPRVILSPVNAAAGQLEYYATINTTGFSVCTNNAAQPNKVFSFDYFVPD